MNKIYFKILGIIIFLIINNANAADLTTDDCHDECAFSAEMAPELSDLDQMNLDMNELFCQKLEADAINRKLSKPITPEELENLKNIIFDLKNRMMETAFKLDRNFSGREEFKQFRSQANILMQEIFQKYNHCVREYNEKMAIEVTPVLQDNNIPDKLIAYINQYAAIEEYPAIEESLF